MRVWVLILALLAAAPALAQEPPPLTWCPLCGCESDELGETAPCMVVQWQTSPPPLRFGDDPSDHLRMWVSRWQRQEGFGPYVYEGRTPAGVLGGNLAMAEGTAARLKLQACRQVALELCSDSVAPCLVSGGPAVATWCTDLAWVEPSEVFTTVPEPPRELLMLAGLVGVIVLRRIAS